MRMETNVPAAAIEDIRKFEDSHDILLPTSYVTFLMQHNGGTPTPSIYVNADGTCINVGLLFSITGDDIDRVLTSIPIDLDDGWLPIGLTGGGDYFVLSLSTGAVYLWRHEIDDHGMDRPLRFLEKDVDTLLRRIETDDHETVADEIRDVAVSGSLVKVATYLQKHSIDRRNKIGYGLVHEAARAGNIEIVRYCLSRGASRAGLMCAGARSENKQMIEYLLDEVGLDINETDEEGVTPLSRVVFDDEIRSYLMERGAHE